MPIATAMASAITASSMVAGKRCTNNATAESPVCTPVEMPKSPDSARPRNFAYWTMTGWSMPSCARRLRLDSSVARSPRRADTGPPGRARSHAKSSSDNTAMTATSWSIRRTVKRSTALALADRVVVLGGQRTRHQPLDVLGDHDGRRRVRDRHRREVLGHDVRVDLLVHLVAG